MTVHDFVSRALDGVFLFVTAGVFVALTIALQPVARAVSRRVLDVWELLTDEPRIDVVGPCREHRRHLAALADPKEIRR